MKKFSKIILAALLVGALSFGGTSDCFAATGGNPGDYPAPYSHDPSTGGGGSNVDPEDICAEMRASGECDQIDCSSLCDDPEPITQRLQSILNVVYFWAGIAAVIVIIISGVYFMISRGEADKIKKAKTALMYAVIGLIIVICAAAITNFVINAM